MITVQLLLELRGRETFTPSEHVLLKEAVYSAFSKACFLSPKIDVTPTVLRVSCTDESARCVFKAIRQFNSSSERDVVIRETILL